MKTSHTYLSSAALWLLLGVLVLLHSACAPLYVKNFKYEERVRAADYDKAMAFLDNSKFYKKPRNRLLLMMEKGKVAHMAGQYEQSNQFFNEADHLIEDYQVNIAAEALSLFTNDEQRPYKAEDFEAVAIHYYKALNYMALRKPNEAMVEARRLNLQLQAMDDKFPDHKNKYDSDALGHILMGQIYEVQGDFNNAFVAYRNALELFDKGRGSYMGAQMPAQLSQDLLRTAYLSGFRSELSYYERRFGDSYSPQPTEGGALIFFWESGLAPVKDEWNIFFNVVPDQNDEGRYYFINNDLNLSFPFDFDRNDDEDPDNDFDFTDLQFLRVAFPKYVFRPDGFLRANISANGKSMALTPVQNLEVIARQSLQDRFLREAARGLARLALKKISEISLRSDEDTEAIGAILGMVNTVTEKADTRHWQTLPATISYVRIPLQKGENRIQLIVQGRQGGRELKEFTVNGNGRTQFLSVHSITQLSHQRADAYFNSLQAEPTYRR